MYGVRGESDGFRWVCPGKMGWKCDLLKSFMWMTCFWFIYFSRGSIDYTDSKVIDHHGSNQFAALIVEDISRGHQ